MERPARPDPHPHVVDRLVAWLFPSFLSEPEAAEPEPEAGL